jgi:ankyrin repeat protein
VTAADMRLLAALIAGDHLQIRRAIDDGVDVNQQLTQDWPPLFWARDFQSVEVLVNSGANPRATDQYGRTPLHYATTTATAEALLKVGADINATDKDNETPLHMATLRGHRELAVLLIDRGAEINKQNHDGDTPLILASARGIVGVAKRLLAAKADPNGANHLGVTALHWATWREDAATARSLVEAGANTIATALDGRNPRQWAERANYLDIVEIFDSSEELRGESGKHLAGIASRRRHGGGPIGRREGIERD